MPGIASCMVDHSQYCSGPVGAGAARNAGQIIPGLDVEEAVSTEEVPNGRRLVVTMLHQQDGTGVQVRHGAPWITSRSADMPSRHRGQRIRGFVRQLLQVAVVGIDVGRVGERQIEGAAGRWQEPGATSRCGSCRSSRPSAPAVKAP
jgi:hypothetical protein